MFRGFEGENSRLHFEVREYSFKLNVDTMTLTPYFVQSDWGLKFELEI